MVELENIEEKERFKMFNVYGPMNYCKKHDFWKSLEGMCVQGLHTNSIVVVDFNATISASERRGGSKVRHPFVELLEELQTSWNFMDVK